MFITTLAISPDGRHVVEHATTVWDLERGIVTHQLIDHSSGDANAVADYLKGTLGQDDRRLRDLVTAVRTPARSSAAVTPDGRQVLQSGEDGIVRIWDLRSGTKLHTLAGHTGPVRSVAITPDGRWGASVCATTLVVWDLANAEMLAAFTGDGGFSTCDITPNGRAVIVDGPGGVFRVATSSP
jgi:WD40 repeat protein